MQVCGLKLLHSAHLGMAPYLSINSLSIYEHTCVCMRVYVCRCDFALRHGMLSIYEHACVCMRVYVCTCAVAFRYRTLPTVGDVLVLVFSWFGLVVHALRRSLACSPSHSRTRSRTKSARSFHHLFPVPEFTEVVEGACEEGLSLIHI